MLSIEELKVEIGVVEIYAGNRKIDVDYLVNQMKFNKFLGRDVNYSLSSRKIKFFKMF